MPLIDNDHQPDPQQLALQQTLATLLPIRRQRLDRAQRQQYQHQSNEQYAQQQQLVQQQQLTQQQQTYQQLRAKFQHHHQPLEHLTQRLEDEKAALLAIERQQQSCHQAQERLQAATLERERAVQQTRQQQKAMEKLEYLSEHLQEMQ